MYSLGIDVGYSSVKVVLINQESEVIFSRYQVHKNRAKQVLKSILKDMKKEYNLDLIRYGAVCGNGSKFITKHSSIYTVNEVTAKIEAALADRREIGSVIDIGAQNAIFIAGINKMDPSAMKISVNSNCSSGTGSFLEEQMSRLNHKLGDFSLLVSQAKSTPRIAGRCSVFAKTDIIHHQQEGVSVPDILLGLSYSVVRNYKSAVIKKLPVKKPVLFSGGVAFNQGIITAMKDVLNLSDEDLIFPKQRGCNAAIGTAIYARKNKLTINYKRIDSLLRDTFEIVHKSELARLDDFGQGDSLHKHMYNEDFTDEIMPCYLGVDIGSTSTNLVLMNEQKKIITAKYLRTLGNPIAAVERGLAQIKEQFGDRIKVIGAATTGSGRYMIGKLIGADVVKDEITAQARSAVEIDPTVDTIFEIGGQDSKYIRLGNGAVVDFQMNKVCAAGTGSFIEEQAKKFNIAIENFGDIALSSAHPVHLGERCTVFIEMSIASCLAKGDPVEDIAAGLCYSIVNNYLDKVVSGKKVGNKIFFQGGLAYNQGVINAFRALTGKEIIVPPYFSVTGAFGAALLVSEAMEGKKSKFKGFKALKSELQNKPQAVSFAENPFNARIHKLAFGEYAQKSVIDPSKKTVGIPRVIYSYRLFTESSIFFEALGFNVQLSDPTTEASLAAAQEYNMEGVCYPMKIISAHIVELINKGVDYIFLPDRVSIELTTTMKTKGYGCTFLQVAHKLVDATMDLNGNKVKILAPTLAAHLGEEYIYETLLAMGKELGKTEKEIQKAIQKSNAVRDGFRVKAQANVRKIEKNLDPNQLYFVLFSKTYALADPALNMGIPEKLMSMRYPVLSFLDLPGEYLAKRRLIREHPNLYPIVLSHHACAPDFISAHFFRQEMKGKPFLHIHVDEHSSSVGVMTRIEAFINSLHRTKRQTAKPLRQYLEHIAGDLPKFKDDFEGIEGKVYLPYLYPFSEIFAAAFRHFGIDAQSLQATNQAMLDVGKKFIITEDYFSFVALIGNVFQTVKKHQDEKQTYMIPRDYGSDAQSRYNRLLRTELDQQNHQEVEIITPYIEELLLLEQDQFDYFSLALIAGDLILTAPREDRGKYLKEIVKAIAEEYFNVELLKTIATTIRKELRECSFNKRILAVGELSIVYDDMLNNNCLKKLEQQGHRVLYSPLSEMFWLLCHDYYYESPCEPSDLVINRLASHQERIDLISELLGEYFSFEPKLASLLEVADQTIGYFGGSNGRYRLAKSFTQHKGVDGVISVASMYENTAIILSILQSSYEGQNHKAILNVFFDGTVNENDQMKIDSFIYYL